jgi:general secretion pathway protein D
VVVNPATNTLIFQGAPESYTQLVGLLQELDRPPRTALIEVTVAEVRLGESENLGIEWALNNRSIGDGYTATGGTLGNLSIGSSGLLVRILTPGGQTRAVINALASQNKARVLSSPRVMARSGESATIQVGQEVPIITSQQTTGSTVGGGIGIQPGILQTVQYKQTGVILRVRPVIHSSGRIELDVQQEVSSAAATNTGVNVSPTFSTRKVETKLSLGDAETVLLAGLISQNQSRSDAGIPVLKDIPGVGQLFRTNTDQTDRTELVVLITPYLVNNDFEARSITEAFRNQLGPWARTQGGAVTTLPRTAPPGQSAPVGPRITTQPGEVPPGAASGTAAGNAPGAQSAPAPAAPLSATSAAPAPAPAGAAPAAPPGGQPVTDPKLLEDLQRAITAPPAGGKPPARPATQPSRPQPQSKP